MKKVSLSLLFFVSVLALSQAQLQTKSSTKATPAKANFTPVRLSGPRVGITYISPGKLADTLNQRFGVKPIFSQFGWQFEKIVVTTSGGTSGLAEFIVLLGGLDQGKVIPSANFVVGLRSKTGFEVGVGPNISLSGIGLVCAAGLNFRIDELNLPLTFAWVPGNKGQRFSVLLGCNIQEVDEDVPSEKF